MSKTGDTLPGGWVMARVDRVGAVRLGRQRSPDKHTGEHATKYLRAANVKPGGLELSDILEMDFTPGERIIFALRAGDILLTEASGSSSQVGRAALWNDEVPYCCYQNTIIRFRPHATIPAYAMVVFRQYAASGAFGRVARGVGIQHLGASRFAEMEFPLPPLQEQKRIAQAVDKRLAEIREAGTHLSKALERLDAQRREILAAAASGELASPSAMPVRDDEALTNRPRGTRQATGRQSVLFDADLSPLDPHENALSELPPTWRWVRVDQVGEVRLGRQRSPEHHHGEHMRPYLRVANVYEDHIDTSDVHEMNFTPDEFVIFTLKQGDILLNEGQSIELVGRPAMFRDELPGACFQNTLIRFRAGPAVDAEFALLIFMHYLHSGQFRNVARGSTNIAHLGLDRFRSMPFPLPSPEEQREIVKEARQRLDIARAQAAAVVASIDRLPEMERELLAAAVAGELAQQDPEDESAEQLLARLGDPTEIVPPKMDNKRRGGSVQPTSTTPTATTKPKVRLGSFLKKAGRPMPLPELFALAGFDRDQPEDVESFYLALRSELGSSIRQIGEDAENAMLEVITHAP